ASDNAFTAKIDMAISTRSIADPSISFFRTTQRLAVTAAFQSNKLPLFIGTTKARPISDQAIPVCLGHIHIRKRQLCWSFYCDCVVKVIIIRTSIQISDEVSSLDGAITEPDRRVAFDP